MNKDKILYLECGMGAAGDMLGAALYELLDEKERRKYLEEIGSAGIEGVRVEAKSVTRAGIAGTHMSVLIDGEEESEEMHEHHHHHHHASLADVHAMIDATSFSDKVKADACAVYDLIAAAESRAHNAEVSEIHFHEVGMKDAVIDVLGVCRLIEMISPAHIYASPVRVGFGEVKCAHGIVPVPAPATAYLLEGIPVYAGDIRGEMCTPTGAALLKFYAEEFISMPVMSIDGTGYGCGTKDFERANCVRAMLGSPAGDTSASTGASAGGTSRTGVVELATNIDDMTGEALGYAAEAMREAGALDVFFTPVYMKKERPGYMLTVLCRSEDEESMTALFFKHTSTWGIRRRDVERHYMDTRIETRDTEFGPVRFKTGTGYGVTKSKPEYEDIARLADERGMSICDIHDRL